jgi:hypothetical protein
LRKPAANVGSSGWEASSPADALERHRRVFAPCEDVHLALADAVTINGGGLAKARDQHLLDVDHDVVLRRA